MYFETPQGLAESSVPGGTQDLLFVNRGQMGTRENGQFSGLVTEPIAQAWLSVSVEEDVCELPLQKLVPAACFSHLLPASLGCATAALGTCGKLDHRSSQA